MNDVSMRPEFVIANVLPGKLNALVKNVMRLTGIEDPVEVVDSINRSEWKLTKVAEAVTTFLDFVGRVTVKVIKPINLDEFFNGGDGLWIDSKFKKLFVTPDATFTPKEYFLTKYRITKNALDSEARAEPNVFEAEDFSPLLATMLYKQWGGTSGEFLTNAYVNIFFIRSKDKKEVFTVRILWDSAHQRWDVLVWDLDVYRWCVGGVIFSPN